MLKILKSIYKLNQLQSPRYCNFFRNESKNLLKDKTDPEIESTINAIANRGFYKEIRLEDAYFSIKDSDLIK